jgi:hypothetical protein
MDINRSTIDNLLIIAHYLSDTIVPKKVSLSEALAFAAATARDRIEAELAQAYLAENSDAALDEVMREYARDFALVTE